MTRREESLIGRMYGARTVVDRVRVDGALRWVCRCACGKLSYVETRSLVSRPTYSCGCVRVEKMKLRNTTHGMTKTPEYAAWDSLRQRCKNKTSSAYKDYGGRGIKVCDRWLHSFENFYSDMGPRPSSSHSIDRVDNNGDYTPDNCRWATTKEQGGNKRRRISEDVVKAIVHEHVNEGTSGNKLAKKYGVSSPTASKIIRDAA